MATEDIEIEVYADDDIFIIEKEGAVYSYRISEEIDLLGRLLGAGAEYEVYSQRT